MHLLHKCSMLRGHRLWLCLLLIAFAICHSEPSALAGCARIRNSVNAVDLEGLTGLSNKQLLLMPSYRWDYRDGNLAVELDAGLTVPMCPSCQNRKLPSDQPASLPIETNRVQTLAILRQQCRQPSQCLEVVLRLSVLDEFYNGHVTFFLERPPNS